MAVSLPYEQFPKQQCNTCTTSRCISETIPLFSAKSTASILQMLSVGKQNKCKTFLLNASIVTAELTVLICQRFELKFECKYCDLNCDCNLNKSFFLYPGKVTERGKQLTPMLNFYRKYGCKWLKPPGSSALRLSRLSKGTRGTDRLKSSVHKLSKEHTSAIQLLHIRSVYNMLYMT